METLVLVRLTEQEFELIETIRNFKKARHNPSAEMEWYIRKLFEDLIEN
jgi:hypothetical protein